MQGDLYQLQLIQWHVIAPLFREYKALEEKYQELMETSSNIESHVLGITSRAEEKWKLACQMQAQSEQLKKELSNTQGILFL